MSIWELIYFRRALITNQDEKINGILGQKNALIYIIYSEYTSNVTYQIPT